MNRRGPIMRFPIAFMCLCTFIVTFVSGFQSHLRIDDGNSLMRRAASYSVKIFDLDEERKPTNERVLELSGEMTILDALLVEGEAAPHSCKAGLCTDCAVLALSGQDNVELEAAILDPETTEKGFLLSCSARVAGDGISLLLGVGEEMYEDQFGDFRRDHESYQEGGSNSENKSGTLDGIFNLTVEA